MATARLYNLNGDAFNISGNDKIILKRRVNGEKELELTIHKDRNNAHYFDDIDFMWKLEFNKETYVVVLVEDLTDGHYYTRRISLLHQFFDDLRNDYKYSTFSGSRTFDDILSYVFEDTGYVYTIVGNFYANTFENFGDDFVLELFKKVLDRYGAEFRLSGNRVYLYPKIGDKTDFQFRYKFNLHSVQRQIDALDFSTYGEGFGKDGLHVTYTSPMAEIYKTSKGGKRHLKAIRDERYTIRSSLYDRVKKEVDESLKISISFDFEDMRKAGYPRQIPNEGDEVLLVDSRLNLKISTRIVEIVETFNASGDVIKCEVTLSNFTNLDEQQKRFQQATKAVADALNGKRPLPFEALDLELQRLANQIFQSESEVTYGSNGIVARDKNNPNKLLILNSAGLLISTDNGQTARLAVTADGIATELLTAGSIYTNNIRIVGSSNFYWDGDALKAIDPNNSNRSVTINSAGIDVRRGMVRVERDDGYATIIGGRLTNDLDVQGCEPPFMSDVVWIDGAWFGTQSTVAQTVNYYTYKHSARYVNFMISQYVEPGTTSYLTIERGDAKYGNREILASSSSTSTDKYDDLHPVVLTVDLGVPTGGLGGLFVRLRTADSSKKAYGRIIRKWLEG